MSAAVALSIFPGTEDSEVLEIEVQAYRRVIRRRRYRPSALWLRAGHRDGAAPATADRAGQVRDVGVGQRAAGQISVRSPESSPVAGSGRSWTEHVCGHAGRRLAGAGTAVRAARPGAARKLRSEPHWHADETRWAVFVDSRTRSAIAGTCGCFTRARWFTTCSMSRGRRRWSRRVGRRAARLSQLRPLRGVQEVCAPEPRGRAGLLLGAPAPRLLGAGQRLSRGVAMGDGVGGAIAELYHLNGLRLQAAAAPRRAAAHHADLQQAVQRMANQRDAALADPSSPSRRPRCCRA